MAAHIAALIEKYQDGDTESAFEIVDMFKPALFKYTGLLKYEDALPDLQLALLSAIHKLQIDTLKSREDGLFVSYINAVIYHEYLALSKRKVRRERTTLLTDDIEVMTGAAQSDALIWHDSYGELMFSEIRSLLTQKEYEVIVDIFKHGQSVSSIATDRGVSRQSVNTTKRRALNKLKEYYS